MQGNYRLMKDNRHIGNFTINSVGDAYTYTAVAQNDQPLLLLRLALRDVATISGEVVIINSHDTRKELR